MIARFWSARATPASAGLYADHFRAQVLPTLQKMDGCAGAMLLERKASKNSEILVITWWHSREAISRFAGADSEKAVVAAEAAALLAKYDRRVRHYDLIAEGDMSQPGALERPRD